MRRDDAGLTLLELLIAMAVSVPLVTMAGASIVTTMRVGGATTDRFVAGTQDQLLTNYLVKDVQSAKSLTPATTGACSTGKVFAVLRHDAQTVSYTFSAGQLVRRLCGTGASTVLAAGVTAASLEVAPSAGVVLLYTAQGGVTHRLVAGRRSS